MKGKEGEFIVRYTNKNIMDKLEEIHELALKTNGKVKLHTKLISAGFAFSMAIILTLIAHLNS